MGFQPFNDAEKLLYPSGQPQISAGIYSTGLLPSAGDRLYSFVIGDFAYPSLYPIPHVEMTLFTFQPGTVNITVYRTVGRRTMPVRGQIKVYAVGGRNVVDWEAPFGVTLNYRAEQFDIDGNSLGFTGSTSTYLDVKQTWVHNPFDPVNAVPVQMLSGASATLPRPIPTETYWAVGSGPAVGISSQRHGLTDVPVPFFTRSEVDANKVRDMFGDPYESPSVPPVLVIRTGAGLNMGLPQPFFALIPEPVETPINAPSGQYDIQWDCSATEVAPPAPALVAAALTYADLDAAFDTYAARDAYASSYLAIDRAYEFTGLSGDNT